MTRYVAPTERNLKILQLAQELDQWGQYKYSYNELAAMFGIRRARVTQICTWSGLPHRPLRGRYRHRTKPGPPTPRFKCPASLREMYRELTKKLGTTEARRVLMEHATIRGIVA